MVTAAFSRLFCKSFFDLPSTHLPYKAQALTSGRPHRKGLIDIDERDVLAEGAELLLVAGSRWHAFSIVGPLTNPTRPPAPLALGARGQAISLNRRPSSRANQAKGIVRASRSVLMPAPCKWPGFYRRHHTENV
jgi:hypothetical protein